MIRLLTIENPFEPKVQKIEELVYLNLPIASYVNTYYRDIFLNGRKIEKAEYNIVLPQDGDELISIPHIASGGGLGKILGFVATVALSAWAGSIVSGGGFFGAQLAAHSLGAYLVSGAVMYLGGRLINAVFPQQTTGNNAAATTTTYGWNLPTVATAEGGVVGETYGVCIPTPQLLEEHIETVDDSTQYLNLLYCGGAGEIDSIDTIRIDSTPISCFTDVQLETRLGTNDQQPISFFDNTPTDQSVGLALDLNAPLIRTTDSTAASSLGITLEWSSGLYHLNDDGSYGTTSVVALIEYRKTGDNDWSKQGSYTVSAATSSSFYKTYKWAVATLGQYDVRVTMTAKPASSRYMTYTQWSILTSYNSGKYCRPGKVLVGMRIKATNQLSGGIPSVNWRQTRNTVYVWNPNTSTYEAKAANNPIWAAYDILHGCRKLKNINTGNDEYVVAGCAHEHLDVYYDEWSAAAAYADEKIVNHNNELEKRFQFDAYFDTVQKRFDAATKAAAVGHAAIVIHGCNYGIVVDKPGEICQVFSEGRTTVSSVSGSFLSRDERAKAVEITYNDTNNDFKNTQFTLRTGSYDTDTNGQDNTAQLKLFGISRRTQAYREGVTALAASERQLQTIELSTDIDGVTAEYGDIVGYAHAISKIGIASGRIVRATNTTVVLDKEVTLEAEKTYEIYMQLSDDTLVKRAVVPVDATTHTLTLTQPFGTIPQQYDCYSFGETDKAVKPFRIVGAERDGDLLVKLKMIEYDAAVYATELDYSKYPDIDYTNTSDYATKNVVASEDTYMQADGTVITNIDISWDVPADYSSTITGYSVVITDKTTGAISAVSTANTYYKYSAIARHSYKIQVNAKITGITVDGGSTTIYVTGKDEPPPDVTGLKAVVNPADRTQAVLSWNPVVAVDLNHYRVKVNGTEYNTAATTTTITATVNNPTVSVVAVDNSGNVSVNPAALMVAIVAGPSDVVGFKVCQKATDRSVLAMSWDAVTDTDLGHYEIRLGDTWASSKTIDVTKSLSTSYQLTQSGYYRIWIAAVNAAGKYSANPVVVEIQAVCEPDQPKNLAYTQDVRNAKHVILEWTAAAGQDIAGYEISRNGVVVGFAADAIYTDTITVSGTYVYSIRTKTVGAFYSGMAYLTAAIMLEPLDVTNFKAVQQLTDKSVVRLTWDANSAGDLSHYEIREGSSWDEGKVVVAHAVGTYADVEISEEKNYTWQIKAVSSNGFYSLYPAIVIGIFSLNPTPVSYIQAKQSADDKSVLNIQWTGVDDKDLAGYQVKIGDVWDSAESLPLTQELYTTYKLTASNGYRIMIKTLNNSGYYSDEMSIDYTAKVEPSDVTGLIAFQNGDTVELYWDKVADADVVGYEVREGYSFDQSSLISTGVTNTDKVISIDTMRLYKFHVKAINRSGYYSKYAVTAMINITSLAPKNVIDTFDEIALASGTHENTEFGQSSLNFQTLGGRFSDYPTTKFSEVGGKSVLKLAKQSDGSYADTGIYTAAIIDIGSVITCNVTTLFTSSTMLRGGTAILQVRNSQDGSTWLDWSEFKPIQRTFRFIQFRVILQTNSSLKTPEVNQCTISIDVPDTDIALSAAIAVGGTKVSYGRAYYTIPYVTPCAIGENLHAELISKDKASCVIKIKDKNNNDVGGAADIRVKGY